jgi:hypothetical protein
VSLFATISDVMDKMMICLNILKCEVGFKIRLLPGAENLLFDSSCSIALNEAEVCQPYVKRPTMKCLSILKKDLL